MESNIKKPSWLTDDCIKDLKQYISECPTAVYDEPEEIILDAPFDVSKRKAKFAIEVLTKYNIPF